LHSLPPQPAAAADYRREDLRIPMEAAGPCGLEAMLLRPGLRRLAKGSFAFRSGGGRRVKRRRRPSACADYAPDCTLYAVDDHLAETASTGSR